MSTTPDRVKCPSCSELILEGARICKHCREILDPALKAEQARAAAPRPSTPQQAAYQRKIAWSLGLSIVGTFVASWALGILLGPLLFWRARRLGKEADRVGVPRPGELAGIYVCAFLSLAIGVIVGSAAGIPLYLHTFGPADVVVDNGLPHEVTFLVDGRREGTVPADEHRRFSVSKGQRRLQVRSGEGTSSHDGRHELKARGKYILNPTSLNNYTIVTNEYTTGPTIRFGYSPPSPEPLAGEAFMDVTRFDFVLESMPSQVQMSPGQYSTQRKGVQRASRASEPASIEEKPATPPPPPVEVQAPPPPPPAAPVRIERRVRLDVTADSWREGGPFAIENELKEKLAAAGVGTAPPGGKKADGTLKVSYSESRGKEYKSIGGGASLGYGTDIDLTVEVLDSNGEELVKVDASGGTPGFVNAASLFAPALESLKQQPTYRFLELFVAAALGMESAMPRLLPALTWEDTKEIAQPLLRSYVPRTPEDRAWAALGRGDYDACVQIGAAAIDPLLDVFDRESDLGSMNEKALAAIVALGGPKARQAVLGQLQMKKGQGEVDADQVLLLVQAAVTLGERGAIPVLEELAKGDEEEVAAAAKKALRVLRKAELPAANGGASAPAAQPPGDAYAARFNERGLDRLKNGKWNPATAFFTQAIEQDPKHGEYYWNRARSQWNARAWRGAISDLEKVVDLIPAREDEARLRIFIARCRLGDRAGAEEELNAFLKDRGEEGSAEWLSRVGSVLTGRLMPQDLVAGARRGGDATRTAQAHFYAGMRLLLQGDSKGASVHFRNCVDAPAEAALEAESARMELEALKR